MAFLDTRPREGHKSATRGARHQTLYPGCAAGPGGQRCPQAPLQSSSYWVATTQLRLCVNRLFYSAFLPWGT